MSEGAPAPTIWALRRLLGKSARPEPEKVPQILRKFGGSKLQRLAA
jgi:hypothetical protein